MSIRRMILFIENVSHMLLIGLFILVVLLVMKARDGKLFVFEMLMALPFMVTFLFRNWIIHYALKRCAYPGVFYAVLDKLRLTHKIDIHLTDSMLDEIYRPAYSTEQFITDNRLKFGVVEKKKNWLPPLFIMLLGVVSLVYFFQKDGSGSFMLLMSGLSIFVGLYTLIVGNTPAVKTDISLIFQQDGLKLSGVDLEWKDVYDWSYESGSEGETGKIILSFYDYSKNLHELIVRPSDYDMNKVDFLMLLTHFKGKYGTSELS